VKIMTSVGHCPMIERPKEYLDGIEELLAKL
jgi:hypothetical protein